MTRSVSATITAAVSQNPTRPVYLIEMGWDVASPDVNRYVATYDTSITWNGITWVSSGAEIKRLSPDGGQLQLPNGDSDPWLNLITTQGQQGKTILVYEYHTDFSVSPYTSDATLIFSGQMDQCEITPREITIAFIEGLTNKMFPATSIDPTVYTHLLRKGSRLYWGPDIVLVD